MPIQKNAVTGQVLERIKEMILSGRFPPGSKLPPERELSAAFGISRSSVREALRVLMHMRIVESRHGQGTFVTSLSPDLLIEPLRFAVAWNDELIFQLFEARKILETGTAALAGERLTDEDRAELRRHYEALIETIDDPPVFLGHDMAMHELIARAARNPILTSLFASISELLRESRSRTGAVAAIRAQTVVDHGAILRAIEARDPEAAAEAMRTHLEHVETKLRDLGEGSGGASRARAAEPGKRRSKGG